ncbi:MAG: AAA family ATPase [Deltaproteobacteria bacterium]|nr:AAA family ATPase [Deltaproteobacteria bacterium]
MYPRILDLPERSFFLFGPRGTGKSVWLEQRLGHAALSINLLKSSEYLRYKRDPSILAHEVAALREDQPWIIIDEVQKLPELLDEVHSLLFESGHGYRFALSGSSARKLKRSHANMLAGRALLKRMFPLSVLEVGEEVSLQDVLRYGQLPLSVTSPVRTDKVEFLDAYVETYLKEEIQQEALVRNLDSFYRLLSVAGLMSGQLLNIANIARDVGVARSTVQGYFSILEDTLLGWYLPAYRNKAKVKEVAHAKFYLFDCGVQRALLGRHRDEPSAVETGALFESFVLNEFRALNSWLSHGAQFFYWRTEAGNEVDLIWKRGERAAGFEIKSSTAWQEKFNKGLNVLLRAGDIEQAFGVYRGDTVQKVGKVTVVPYRMAIEMAREGGFVSTP